MMYILSLFNWLPVPGKGHILQLYYCYYYYHHHHHRHHHHHYNVNVLQSFRLEVFRENAGKENVLERFLLGVCVLSGLKKY